MKLSVDAGTAGGVAFRPSQDLSAYWIGWFGWTVNTRWGLRAEGFVYPANQKSMRIGVWAAEERTLDSGNKFYGFGPQEAYSSTNTGGEKLGVICIK